MPQFDKYAYHELIDRASVTQENFYNNVLDHHITASDPELTKKAEEIHRLIGDFYYAACKYADTTLETKIDKMVYALSNRVNEGTKFSYKMAKRLIKKFNVKK